MAANTKEAFVSLDSVGWWPSRLSYSLRRVDTVVVHAPERVSSVKLPFTRLLPLPYKMWSKNLSWTFQAASCLNSRTRSLESSAGTLSSDSALVSENIVAFSLNAIQGKSSHNFNVQDLWNHPYCYFLEPFFCFIKLLSLSSHRLFKIEALTGHRQPLPCFQKSISRAPRFISRMQFIGFWFTGPFKISFDCRIRTLREIDSGVEKSFVRCFLPAFYSKIFCSSYSPPEIAHEYWVCKDQIRNGLRVAKSVLFRRCY